MNQINMEPHVSQALISILLNQSDLEIGDNLQNYKNLSQHMNPKVIIKAILA